jgi:hypothetical protein
MCCLQAILSALVADVMRQYMEYFTLEVDDDEDDDQHSCTSSTSVISSGSGHSCDCEDTTCSEVSWCLYDAKMLGDL